MEWDVVEETLNDLAVVKVLEGVTKLISLLKNVQMLQCLF